MRIIGGKLRGQTFKAPSGHRTHPMSERVRGALFNTLGDIAKLKVLDAYAGSGALSFEAISRGATHAQLVDIDKIAVESMKAAAHNLGINQQLKITKANISSWSKNNQNEKFDLIFVDPPYDRPVNVNLSLLSGHLKNKGLMVLSYPGRESMPTVNGVVVVDNKSYGDAALAFYRLANS